MNTPTQDDGHAGCDGKHRFPSRAHAELAAQKARQRPRHGVSSRGRIQSYRCRRCGGWHIGAYAVRKPISWRLRLALRRMGRFDWRRTLASVEQDG